MAKTERLQNHVQEHRIRRGWSQEDLAARSGLSRAGISAIEMNRLVPSTAAALALASVFGCRVEDLFQLTAADPGDAAWAWVPDRDDCRYWQAQVGGRKRFYPVEASPLGVIPHDGVFRDGSFREREATDPAETLVVACCDPAVGLLAAELAAKVGVRLLVLPRSSRDALSLLGKGLVHAAGVHLSRAGRPQGNAGAVKDQLGVGYQLLRVARWEEGIAFPRGLKIASVRAAVRPNVRWIGREAGSGARECLDEILDGRRPPRRLASNHRGVAEAIRNGWADVGVCLRLVSDEFGLDFLGVRQEVYDLCFPERWQDDRRVRALVEVVRSASYRSLLGELPGYDSADTGELQTVT
jgi:molybdate-binding protein/DNA-binding XRE family transcriptional regulator